MTGPAQALPASAGAGTSNGDQQSLSQQAAGETHAVHISAEQQQRAGIEPAPNDSSNGHAEAGKPDLQQPKVKQEPREDDSSAGQPHQATDDLSPSSSNAQTPIEVKQEGGNQIAEPMQIDLPAENASHSSQPAPVDVAAGDMPISGQAQAEQSEGTAGRGTPEQGNMGSELAVVPEQAAVQVAPMSTEEAAERCELLCALCTKSPQLLRMLLEVFGKVQHRSPEPQQQAPSYMCIVSIAQVLAQCCQNGPVCCTWGSTRAGSSHCSRRRCHLTLCVKPRVPEQVSVHLSHLLDSTTSLKLPCAAIPCIAA